jgi:serine/threonine protein phosphatase PrpC
MKYEFKVHTDKGIVREVNEDNMGHMLNTPSGDIFVVCDGMGGHVGGQTASTIGVESIISNLVQRPQSNLHVGISNALIFANEQVLGRTVMEPSLKGMGSTATVAVIKDDLLYVGHVGDSRAYIFSDGKLYRITRDDSYVQMLVDNNTITEDQAETHPQKNRILKALGSQSALEPNSAPRPFKMKTGDVLLLCSDGLCSMVVDEAIEQLIDTNDLQGSINQMHSMAMNNGGKDNITIILLKVTESPHLTSDFTHFTTKYQNQPIKNVLPVEEPAGLSLPVNEKPSSRFGLAIGIAASLFIGVGAYFYFSNEKEATKQVNLNQNNSNKEPENQQDNQSKSTNSGITQGKGIKERDAIITSESQENNENDMVDDNKKTNNKEVIDNKNPKYKKCQKEFNSACSEVKKLESQKNTEKDMEKREKIQKELDEALKKRDAAFNNWKANGGLGAEADDPKNCDECPD